MGERFLWRAVKDQLAAHQHYDLVKQPDVFHRVRRQHNGAAAFGDLAEELHDLFFRRRIQARSWLVKKDHRRFGDQLDRNRDAFALAAGQLAHRHIAAFRQAGHVHHFVDDLIDLFGRNVAR